MTTLKEDLTTLVNTLKEQRDELNVQLHLAKQEMQDDWAALEASWGQLLAKVDSISKEAEDAGHDIADAAKELGEQIKAGYERLRKQI